MNRNMKANLYRAQGESSAIALGRISGRRVHAKSSPPKLAVSMSAIMLLATAPRETKELMEIVLMELMSSIEAVGYPRIALTVRR
jgi:hypothetical protein